MIAHNSVNTSLFVPEAIGPQRREIIAALDRLARHGARQWKSIVELNDDFFDVPDVTGLLITKAHAALDGALEEAGRTDARAKVTRYALEMVEAIAQDASLRIGATPGSFKQKVVAKEIGARLSTTAENALSALAARDLISDRGFTQAQYNQLTGPWMFSLGQLHPEDPGYFHAPQPPTSLLPPKTLQGLGPNGPYVQTLLHRAPQLTYDEIKELVWAHDRNRTPTCADAMMSVGPIDDPVRKRAFEHAVSCAKGLSWTLAQQLLPEYEPDKQWPANLSLDTQHTDPMGELVVLITRVVYQPLAGLMFRERMRPGNSTDQSDYDYATGAWRIVIGAVHPDDPAYTLPEATA